MTQIDNRATNRDIEVVKLDPDALSRLGPLIESLSDACSTIATQMAELRKALEVTRLKSLRNATTGVYARAMLRQIFGDFVAHEPGTRLGEDPEELHQMRVASRRLRATIDLFEPALTPEFAYLKEELRWVGGMLGGVRDLQVQRASLLDLIDGFELPASNPLIEKLAQQTRDAQGAVAKALDSSRYRNLVQGMTAALSAESDAADESKSPIRPYASAALRDRYKTVRKRAARLRIDSPDAELHRVRIKIKRLRYAAETFQPLFGKRLKPLRGEAKALQDLLGEHQDHVAARAWMGEIAVREARVLPADALIQIGALVERRRHEMILIRLVWPEAYVRLGRRWRRVKRHLKSGKS
jgi:CHAD domain-containing protein